MMAPVNHLLTFSLLLLQIVPKAASSGEINRKLQLCIAYYSNKELALTEFLFQNHGI
jgi:hypothetical protein